MGIALLLAACARTESAPSDAGVLALDAAPAALPLRLARSPKRAPPAIT